MVSTKDAGYPRTIWWVGCGVAAILWLILLYGYMHFGSQCWLMRNAFPGGNVMDDLYTYGKRVTLLGTPAFYVPHEVPPMFAYLPGAAYFLKFFYRLPHTRILYVAFFALVLCCLMAELFTMLRGVAGRGALVATLPLLTFPLIFCLERGNIEVFLGFLLFGAFALLRRGHPYPAAVLIGLAATMKPFPIFFCGLFLARPIHWRALLTSLGTTALVTVALLWRAGPTIPLATRGFLAGILNIQDSRAETTYTGGFPFDHSLFSLIKALSLRAHWPVATATHVYYCGVAVLLLWGGWRVARLPFLNRLAFYTVAAVAFSPISYQYTMLEAYPLLLVYFASAVGWAKRGAFRANEAIALTALVCLFLPFTLFGVRGVHFGGQLNAVLLGLTLILALRRGFPVAGASSGFQGLAASNLTVSPEGPRFAHEEALQVG